MLVLLIFIQENLEFTTMLFKHSWVNLFYKELSFVQSKHEEYKLISKTFPNMSLLF